ncbi:MAG: phosphotransferase family protein [Bacteroidota bacterium]
MLDQPKDIRKGEELDLKKLSEYLAGINPEWSDLPEVKQFPSGFSNLTYWLKIGEKEFVLRKPPHGANAKGGHDMHREFTILDNLYPVFDKVPKPFHYCEDPEVIGGPFYLMERVKGIILRRPGGKSFTPLPEQAYKEISTSWLDTFVELHQLDYQAAGLGELGRPEGYVERQITGWSKRYTKAQTSAVKEIAQVMKWLNTHMPPDSGASLIHNDYKYDNIVYQEGDWTQIIAILDWEMSTLGDPLMDLGTSVAYWIDQGEGNESSLLASIPTYFPGNPTREELVHQYSLKSGIPIDNFVFYYVYGLFKLAVVVQQIYYRYEKGFTKDPRFAQLDQMAQYLCVKGLQAIQKNRIYDLF